MIFAPSSPITNSSGIYLSVYQNDRRSSRKEFGVAAAADPEQSRTRAATVIVERISNARVTIKAKASLSRQCSHEFILAIRYSLSIYSTWRRSSWHENKYVLYIVISRLFLLRLDGNRAPSARNTDRPKGGLPFRPPHSSASRLVWT